MDDDDRVEAPPFSGLETDLDDESFRSDLERDSAHSSLVNQVRILCVDLWNFESYKRLNQNFVFEFYKLFYYNKGTWLPK